MANLENKNILSVDGFSIEINSSQFFVNFKVHVLPVIKSSTTNSFFINVESEWFDKNEFKVESNRSTPDTPGVTGNFRRY